MCRTGLALVYRCCAAMRRWQYLMHRALVWTPAPTFLPTYRQLTDVGVAFTAASSMLILQVLSARVDTST